MNFVLVPWSICNGCFAHAGWLDSWNGVKSLVRGAVDGARATYPGYKIVSTGHSLGGALATLAAAELRKAGYTIDLVFLSSGLSHMLPLTDVSSTLMVHRWWATVR